MNSRLYKVTLSITLLTSIILTAPAHSQHDSDSLLLTIPAIAASAAKDNQSTLSGIEKIRLLQGRWRFSYDSFIEFKRFNRSTASTTSDPSIFTIKGNSWIFNDFSSDRCEGGLIGGYSTQSKSYLVLCNWGASIGVNLGSLFQFNSVNPSFTFRHFYYTPSNGELSTGLFDNGTATQLSTTFNLPLDQPLNQQAAKNNTEESITVIKNKRYNDLVNSKAPRKRSLNANSQATQVYLKKLLNLQKTVQ